MMISSHDYKALSPEDTDKLLGKMSKRFTTKPMHHQSVAMLFAIDRDAVGLFFDIGVGKSLTALYISKYIWKAKRILVVCPNYSIMKTWEEQTREHTSYNVHILDMSNERRKKALRDTRREEGVWVLTYSGARSIFTQKQVVNGKSLLYIDEDFIDSLGFDAVVYDESHHIKNHDTDQTIACCNLAVRIPKAIVMSGTPASENYLNLWSQIYCLDGGQRLGRNFFGFRYKYFYEAFHKWKMKAGAGKQILNKIDDIVLSYAQEECFDLPDLVFEKRHTLISNEQREKYDEAHEGLVKLMHGGQVRIDTMLKLISKMSQISNGFIYDDKKEPEYYNDIPKAKELRKVVEECWHRGGKIIVYHRFHADREIIRKSLKGLKGVEYVESSADLAKKWDKIQKNKMPKVVVTTPNVFGEGVNFTVADTIIFYSQDYSGEKRSQAIGRIHRKGQEKKCLVIDMLNEHTIDEDILHIAMGKLGTIQEIKDYFITEF
jgi:SNF2 family DNA or RNA helicase